MKTMSKSAKKFFAAAVCMSMLLIVFVGCNQAKQPNRKSLPNSKNLIIRKSRVSSRNLPKRGFLHSCF